MKENTLTPLEIKLNECEPKRAQLAAAHNCVVHCFGFPVSDKDIAILYIKEPDRYTKMKAIDVSSDSMTAANSLVLGACSITAESDSRFFDGKSENDKLYLGALMKCSELVQWIIGDVKKK